MTRPASLAPLHQAVLAAQRDARPVEMTEQARTRGLKHGRPVDQEWSYAPAEAVAAEAHRLLHKHGLLIYLVSCAVTGSATGQQLTAVYRLVHADTGASETHTSTGPLMDDDLGAGQPQRIAATERYAWRCLVLRLLAIPVVKPAPQALQAGRTDMSPGPAPHPDITPPEMAVPPFTMERMFAALEAWQDWEEQVNAPSGGGRPNAEQAMAWCLLSAGQAPVRRMPMGERECTALYYWLREQAARHSYAIREAA